MTAEDAAVEIFQNCLSEDSMETSERRVEVMKMNNVETIVIDSDKSDKENEAMVYECSEQSTIDPDNDENEMTEPLLLEICSNPYVLQKILVRTENKMAEKNDKIFISFVVYLINNNEMRDNDDDESLWKDIFKMFWLLLKKKLSKQAVEKDVENDKMSEDLFGNTEEDGFSSEKQQVKVLISENDLEIVKELLENSTFNKHEWPFNDRVEMTDEELFHVICEVYATKRDIYFNENTERNNEDNVQELTKETRRTLIIQGLISYMKEKKELDNKTNKEERKLDYEISTVRNNMEDGGKLSVEEETLKEDDTGETSIVRNDMENGGKLSVEDETLKEDDTGETSIVRNDMEDGVELLVEDETSKKDVDNSSSTNEEIPSENENESFEINKSGSLVSDDQQQSQDIEMTDEEHVRLGVEFDVLLRAPDCSGVQHHLIPTAHHTILFIPYNPSQPFPCTYRDKWDRNHVRMPCSPQNKYPAKDDNNTMISRWSLICKALEPKMENSFDLENAVRSYHNPHFSLRLLHILLLENISPQEHTEFLHFTLPGIIRLALALPEICTESLPILKRQQEHTITMTQQQAACILACAFLCMFPGRNKISDGHFTLPTMNFTRLFELEKDCRPSIRKIEKLKCFIHYFNRVLKQPPCGTISFKRQVLTPDDIPKWHNDKTKLCNLRVSSDGTIEDDAPGMLQVDFANKMVGGGVLGRGCVQEEIRFTICPELLVSRLFTDILEDNECLIVTGVERFSNYTGYADSFRFAGDHIDQTPRDSWGRRVTSVVAIDAKPNVGYSKQFSPTNLKRELEKAFSGFLSRGESRKHSPAVATGNWGCGAFNGDPQLKSLIQIMAASAAQRDVLYFTFGDKDHALELNKVHIFLTENNISIGQVWGLFFGYQKELRSGTSLSLFAYIYQNLQQVL